MDIIFIVTNSYILAGGELHFTIESSGENVTACVYKDKTRFLIEVGNRELINNIIDGIAQIIKVAITNGDDLIAIEYNRQEKSLNRI